jgi:competence ComEA-like helix-hairpin-helix protein
MTPERNGRWRPGWGFAASAVILGATIFVRALHGAPLQAPASDSTEAEAAQTGEDTTVKVCTECHEFDQVVAVRRTPREWKDMVTTMANKGAVASSDEFAAIREYLTRYYGVVAVNAAPAADLSAVLGLSPKDADAVVTYRTEHGKFANLETLAKVPGLEKSKLEAQADALRFD